ncbi:MAG: hypothetical protein F4Z95_10975 [Gammaproteobacteria bacterium]|nr:hypothetical protein [Gammaproteobacteria bacterium]
MNKDREALTELFGAIFDEKGNLLEEAFSDLEKEHEWIFRQASVRNALAALILVLESFVRSPEPPSRALVGQLIEAAFHDVENKKPFGEIPDKAAYHEIWEMAVELWKKLS